MQTLRTKIAGQTTTGRRPGGTGQRPSHQTGRSGFSLVELLMVILIIAALMALILPSLGGARDSARLAQVKAEVTRLETAIAAFKARYNVNPPSFIAIPATGSAWTGIYASSRRELRKIWPQFSFATNGGLGNTGPVFLSGDECLVFFVGGVYTGSATSPAYIGFSKNPATPFSSTGANRDSSFYEFDPGRFVDIDGDGLLSYIDTLSGQTSPFLYISLESKSNVQQQPDVPDTFDIANVPTVDSSGVLTAWVDRQLGNPALAYHQNAARTVKWKKDSYQLISPGKDNTYGAASSTAVLGALAYPASPAAAAGDYVGEGFYEASGSVSREESDNIANFITGSAMGN